MRLQSEDLAETEVGLSNPKICFVILFIFLFFKI